VLVLVLVLENATHEHARMRPDHQDIHNRGHPARELNDSRNRQVARTC